ncbi:hypothetical protein [Paenibacillus taiwanensis]|uniref:hypothetical protein n=1 Tax=Paenibacillus taiwanensis TaxID=401638 RepID=UPI00048DACB4|nr:hypothetical protein [Paenibacillus taiwanensis]
MKRKIASRKLKRSCDCCGCSFEKGETYYHKRNVMHFYDGRDEIIIGVNKTKCPKCHYRQQDSERRYEQFRQTCQHKKIEFIREVWDYIPGEAVMEPQYDVCHLCGNTL